MRYLSLASIASIVLSAVFAHPLHGRSRRDTTSLDILSNGNKAFRDRIANSSDPALLQQLTDQGQAPPFLILECSDSRVSEGTVFDVPPGTIFGARNIANIYSRSDENVEAIVAYGVSVLGVEHVIIMGHYGCGGVSGAIASPPSGNMIDAAAGSIQGWIEPIRELFQQSNRSEIVALRNSFVGQSTIPEPKIHDPGYRALVEENVKAGVARLARDSVIANHYHLLANNASSPVTRRAAPMKDVFVHGFVYDIETGIVHDLRVSVGPPGKPIPPMPFDPVPGAN